MAGVPEGALGGPNSRRFATGEAWTATGLKRYAVLSVIQPRDAARIRGLSFLKRARSHCETVVSAQSQGGRTIGERHPNGAVTAAVLRRPTGKSPQDHSLDEHG